MAKSQETQTDIETVTITVTISTAMREKWKESSARRSYTRIQEAIKFRMQEWVAEDEANRFEN